MPILFLGVVVTEAYVAAFDISLKVPCYFMSGNSRSKNNIL